MILRSVGFVTLRNYQEALAHYEWVTPLRSGGDKGRRPIGTNRRYTYCLIDRENDGVIVASLYNHPVVKYYPHGEIHICTHYSSVSTRQFIQGVTGFDAFVSYDREYIRTGKDRTYYYPHQKHTMVLNAAGECLNPVQEYSYSLNRKAMATARSMFAPFIEYANNMGLITQRVSNEEIERAAQILCEDDLNVPHKMSRITPPSSMLRDTDAGRREIDRLKATLDKWERIGREGNLEQMYCEFVRIVASSCNFLWREKSYGVWEGDVRNLVINFIDNIIKFAYSEMVFDRKEVPIGQFKSNSNRRYFI